MSNGSGQSAVSDIEAMRQARQRPAVLKLLLAALRSSVSDRSVLVFEGDDDKIIYSQWLNRIRGNTRYLMFPCNGKGRVLSFRDLMKSDKTGLNSQVYYFIDRDFDDLRGYEGGPDLFMTESYSVENYLVSTDVVAQALDVEFHCHAHPEIRNTIVSKFEITYDKFLACTKEVNCRLFIAKRCGIDVKALPNSLTKIASVSLNTASSGSMEAKEVVFYLTEPDPNQAAQLIPEFNILSPKNRYRGKYAFLFLRQWLRELAAQNNLADRGVFSQLTNNAAFRLSELTLSNFASRSQFPEGLMAFINTIP